MPNKLSCGFNGVSNVLVKELSEELVIPLAIIYNTSLPTGVFLSRMKHADIVSLYKSGPRNISTNYRPISLLITLSKILEKIVYARIYNFLNLDQIYVSQYGFRNQHSCNDAVKELISAIVKRWEKQESTIALFLDLSKAFNTLEHTVLYNKLEKYGIRGIALDWFKSYLTGRMLSVKSRVAASGSIEKSQNYEVTYGSPQGSCLGPLIFLIFSNDLHFVLENCNCILLADDTTVYKTHYSKKYLESCLMEDLFHLADWFRANKLTLNLKKTVCMFFSHNNKSEKINLSFEQSHIPQVTSTKFLGIWIDEKLTWKEHCKKLKIKLYKNRNLLCNSMNILNAHTMKLLYYAQIYSHLVYGNTLWGNGSAKSDIQQIQKIQNKCLCCVTKRKNLNKEHCDQLGMLSIEQIVKLENLKFAYKFYHDLLPKKIKECVLHDQYGKSLQQVHKYSTRNKSIIKRPRSNCKAYYSSLLCKSIEEFRTLQGETHNIRNLHGFTKTCKKIIMKGQNN